MMKILFTKVIRKFILKYTVVFALLAALMLPIIYMSTPLWFKKRGEFLIENIELGRIKERTGRFTHKYIEVYYIKTNDLNIWKTIQIGEVNSFGLDKIIGRKAICWYSDSKIKGKFIYKLVVDNQQVFGPENNDLLFVVTLFLALVFTSFALWGIIDEF